MLRREQHVGMQVEALFFDIDQGARDWERAAARAVAGGASVTLREVSLVDWRKNFPRHVEMLVVPRNLIFALLAVPYARALSCDWIALGSTADDAEVADSNGAAVAALNALFEQIVQPMRLKAPWLEACPREWDKAEIVRWSDTNLGPAFIEQTRSCYGKAEQPCGTCRACQSRNDAIRHARGG
jgi:7-cyano-7-deazaguanine synthase in queuosine biosynthesis